MEKLEVNERGLPKAKIETQDQAVQYAEALVEDMLFWRRECDIQLPGRPDDTVRRQQRSLWTFLTKQGKVTGALQALYMVGMISERCYRELTQKATNSLIPTLVRGA